MSRTRIRYGSGRGQTADLWLPRPGRGSAEVRPVVVLVHGGFWRARYTKVLMTGLARAVVAEGWAAWNIEYRRVGRFGGQGGWPGTFVDVARAVDHLDQLGSTATLDLGRVVACGHSAGGHLALWTAGRSRLPAGSPGADPRVPLAGTISLAGIPDLHEAAAAGLGDGAVPDLLGGAPTDAPDAYRLASPAALLPLGVPQVLVHGLDDDVVPAEMSERYVARARALGDDARYAPVPGAGHSAALAPGGAMWAEAVTHLRRLLEA